MLIVSACDGPPGSPVPINTGDTSPPVIVSLKTQCREGGELQVTPASGPNTGTLAADESMAVVALAEDPQGVRRVEIWGTDEKTCTDPQSGLSTRTGPGLQGAPLVESTDTATFPGDTRTQRTVRHPVVMTSFTCPQGQRLSLEWCSGRRPRTAPGQRAAISPFLTLTLDES